MSEFDIDIEIAKEDDIIRARSELRKIIDEQLKFSTIDRMMVVTAASELARNILKYAAKGRLQISLLTPEHGKRGIKMTFHDQGPGIANLEEAMKPREISNYQKGMGIGLSGSKKLADEFNILTAPGVGTTINWIRWER